jgi:hypothetical protein
LDSLSVAIARDEDDNNKLKIKIEGAVKQDKVSTSNRSIYVKVFPIIKVGNVDSTNSNEWIDIKQSYSIPVEFSGKDEENGFNGLSGEGEKEVHIIDSTRSDVQKKLKEYAEFSNQEISYTHDLEVARTNVDTNKSIYDDLEEEIEEYKQQKIVLNKLFFGKYSRFIQEGTWIDEKYVDDELYYADAQSVMYNSCYPQVGYSVNVIELSRLPGYEDFVYNLGDRTYVEDPEFFGEDYREKVIITEIVENLDNPDKNQIKLQNFKNQFQDLFQKITATVQQTKYSTGSYEKAVALAEANQERKN